MSEQYKRPGQIWVSERGDYFLLTRTIKDGKFQYAAFSLITGNQHLPFTESIEDSVDGLKLFSHSIDISIQTTLTLRRY